jgi:hypothetical protein
MKTLNLRPLFLIAIVVTLLSSCNTMGHMMQEGNTTVELDRDDFTMSKQVSGSAEQIKILGIDWSRFFTKKGSRVSVPVLGAHTKVGRCGSYAMYTMLENHEGYDVVFYPTFHTEKQNILWVFQKTTVTVNARLGKIK